MIEKDEWFDVAQSLFNGAKPGDYILRDLFGELWEAIGDPRTFGRAVKRWARQGAFSRIHIGEKTSENHQTYVIV